MSKKPTLFDAVGGFLGPLSAVVGRIIDEGDVRLPVMVDVAGYSVEFTLRAIKDLDRAYMAEFERREKRLESKFKRDALLARCKKGSNAP